MGSVFNLKRNIKPGDEFRITFKYTDYNTRINFYSTAEQIALHLRFDPDVRNILVCLIISTEFHISIFIFVFSQSHFLQICFTFSQNVKKAFFDDLVQVSHTNLIILIIIPSLYYIESIFQKLRVDFMKGLNNISFH